MLKELKWNNHPILGDLVLDFSKSQGGVYNTIVLAGENGTGKTTILETIGTFLNLSSIAPFDYIKYEIGNVDYTIRPFDFPTSGFHTRKNENTGTEKQIRSNKSNNISTIETDLEDIRHYGCSYSKARSGFSTKKVTSSSTQQLDSSKYEDDQKDDFTLIKQLIVDIDTQDNSDWMDITTAGVGTSFEDFRHSSRKYRFEQAFNNFFDAMRFKKVDNSQPDEKRILFEKRGKAIAIDSLSTGEKQIVFRGAHLLKNSGSVDGGVILIDEPELSMHPKWQNKILKYYRDLYTRNGTQTAQMIFATHSEYVLRSALENRNDVLVIVLSDNSGIVEAKKIVAPTVLPTITSAETNYLAFDVVTNDYHIELYGCLQSKVAASLGKVECSVKECDTYITQQADYNAALHRKPSVHVMPHRSTNYETLPTYIRNAIDHPDPRRTFSQQELRTSIELLIKLC